MPRGPWPLDQGAEGACTGYGLVHELAAGPIQVPGLTDATARQVYEQNRAEDRAAGNVFPEGATVLATMRAAKRHRRITGYRWAFGAVDVLDTLATFGPVCLGIPWTSSMYYTTPGGRVEVSGEVVGGHFITAVGYEVHPEWGPCALLLNSWGRYWGVAHPRLGVPGGIGYLPAAELAALLADDGEAVVPTDFLPAPPVPSPAAPARPAARPGALAWLRNWLRR